MIKLKIALWVLKVKQQYRSLKQEVNKFFQERKAIDEVVKAREKRVQILLGHKTPEVKTPEELETERKALKVRFKPTVYAFAKRKDRKAIVAAAKAVAKDPKDSIAIRDAVRAAARRAAMGIPEDTKEPVHPDRLVNSKDLKKP